MFEVRTTPVFDRWLADLRDLQAQARIVTRIRTVERGGLGDVKPVGEGVSEMRLTYGPGYRLYFCRRGQTIVVLLCGSHKKTQRADIARAKALAKEV